MLSAIRLTMRDRKTGLLAMPVGDLLSLEVPRRRGNTQLQFRGRSFHACSRVCWSRIRG